MEDKEEVNWAINADEIVGYVARALVVNTQQTNSGLIIGRLPKHISDKIFAATDLRVDDALVRITASYIKHAHKKHGDVKEYERGQIRLEVMDYAFLPSVISNSVTISSNIERGKTVLKFESTLDIKRTLVFTPIKRTATTRGDFVLEFNTYYKRKA